MINPLVPLMPLLCSMMWTTLFVVMTRSVNTGLIKKMVQALDAVPWNERQWGHWLARNAINTKRKLGLGAKGRAKGKKKKNTPKI